MQTLLNGFAITRLLLYLPIADTDPIQWHPKGNASLLSTENASGTIARLLYVELDIRYQTEMEDSRDPVDRVVSVAAANVPYVSWSVRLKSELLRLFADILTKDVTSNFCSKLREHP